MLRDHTARESPKYGGFTPPLTLGNHLGDYVWPAEELGVNGALTNLARISAQEFANARPHTQRNASSMAMLIHAIDLNP